MKKRAIALLLITVILCLFGFAYARSDSEYGFGVRHKIETDDGVFYITIEDVRVLYGDWSLIAKNKSKDTVFISVHAIVENESVKNLTSSEVAKCMDIIDEDGFSLEFYNVSGMEDGKYEVCPDIKAGAKKRGSYPYYATNGKFGFTLKISDGSEFRLKVRKYDRASVFVSLPAPSPAPTPNPMPILGPTSESSVASGSVKGSASEPAKQSANSAEDFSLHSGVRFRMSRDEVKKIEAERGFSVTESRKNYTRYNENGDIVEEQTNVLIISGTMAGIRNSRLYYYFDDSDRLFGAVYDFGEHTILSFEDIQQLVVSKYAERKAQKDYMTAEITDTYFNSRTDGIYAHKLIQIENNDNTIITIVHSLLYTNLKDYTKEVNIEFSGRHYLEYRITTIDEIEASIKAVNLKKQREEEKRKMEEEEQERQRYDDI